MIDTIVTLICLSGLMALVFVSGRRVVLSKSSNIFLYAAFFVVAFLSVGVIALALMQGSGAVVIQAVPALIILASAWQVLRLMSSMTQTNHYRPYQNRSTYYATVTA